MVLREIKQDKIHKISIFELQNRSPYNVNIYDRDFLF